MDTKKLDKLLKDGENEELEFKISLPRFSNLAELISSMANTKGGYILIGVKDDGSVSGIEKSEKIKSEVIKAASHLSPPLKLQPEYFDHNGKSILVVKVPRAHQIHFSSRNKYLRRVGDRTINVSQSRLSDGTLVYSESGTVSYIESFNVPNMMHPGDEIVRRTLVIKPHKKTLRISFVWGDDSIKVVGAHMVEHNVFEFPPDEETRSWYLKFCADSQIPVDCEKQIYINVDVIYQNKWIYYSSKTLAYSLIALSFLPIISTFLNEKTFLSLSVSGAFSIPIPVVTVISFILLSRKINVAIQRLANIKLTINAKYNEKAITDPDNIQLQSIKIEKKLSYAGNDRNGN